MSLFHLFTCSELLNFLSISQTSKFWHSSGWFMAHANQTRTQNDATPRLRTPRWWCWWVANLCIFFTQTTASS